jgi:HisJ family histidinol phosphate phosphatase
MNYKPNHDLHNHTIHCDHAKEDATVSNLIDKARTAGLEYFGISEHVWLTEQAYCIEEVRRDIKNINLTQEHPRILLGVELDPDPIKMDGSFVADIPDIDYIILSIHRLPKSGIGVWRFNELNVTNKERKVIGEQWLQWLENCITYARFQILGHPLRFPIELKLFDLKDDVTFHRVYNILKKLALRNASFEINNGLVGTLINNGYIHTYAALVRELKKAGIKFSFGSDSHSSSTVGDMSKGEVLVNLAGIEECDWIKPGKWIK